MKKPSKYMYYFLFVLCIILIVENILIIYWGGFSLIAFVFASFFCIYTFIYGKKLKANNDDTVANEKIDNSANTEFNQTSKSSIKPLNNTAFDYSSNTDKTSNIHTDKIFSVDKLSIPEILMLHYAETFFEYNNVFQSFWRYRYEVDPDKILDKLLTTGYIQKGSYATSLKRKTVAELKELLKKYSLPVSGKKQTLIIRILDTIPDDELNDFCRPRAYALTEKGKEITEKYPSVLYAHRHPDYQLTPNEIFDDSADIKDIAFDKIFKDIKYQIANNKFGLARNDFCHLYEISVEKQDYKSALEFILTVSYIDLSGVSDKSAIEHGIMTPGENYCCVLLPFCIKNISHLIDCLSMEIETFIKECCYTIDNINLPYSFYSKTCVKEQIINSVLEFRNEPMQYNSY